ncbi:hypothetical protein [Streptomyces filipinensis]|nr:hypothetical protein [Streptomyces filipinensis]
MTTTATTVAGRPLSDWTRDARHGTWHALLPARSGEPVRGALRVDRALLTPEGARERLAAAVLATAKLRLPGLLGTVDLVAEAGEVWLITARPPAPVLADVLHADGLGQDAGSAASVLNETAQTLLALHAAGFAHGCFGPHTVALAPDGVALLTEAALATVLGDTPAADTGPVDAGVAGTGPVEERVAGTRAADTRAWAALARTLATAWATADTPAADLLTRCAAAADTEGLAAARATLVSGRGCLPPDFLRRTALRAAVTRTSPAFPPPPTRSPADGAAGPVGPPLADHAAGPAAPPPDADRADGPALPAEHATVRARRVAAPAEPDAASAEQRTARARRVPASAGSDAASAERATALGRTPASAGSDAASAERATALGRTPASAGSDASSDEQVTVLGRTRRTPASAGSDAAPDPQATVLGRRHQGGPSAGPVGEGGGGGEILLRFGPGVPADATYTPAAPARTAPPGPRRRRRGRLGAVALAAIAALLLWLFLRPTPAPAVLAVRVHAPAKELRCGQTADLTGDITTDGTGGPVTYHWLRGAGHDTGELVSTARRGARTLRVHLRWTVRGPGRLHDTARLRVAHRPRPLEATATFTYACP